MSNKVTITSSNTSGQLTGLRPGATIVLKTRIVGSGSVSITDHDSDALQDHSALTTTQTKTVDLAGSILNIAGASLDGTSAHVVSYEYLTNS